MNRFDDDLHEELAEEAFSDDGAHWGSAVRGVPGPFVALQCPPIQTDDEVSAWPQTVANLIVNLLGVGMLAMPRALASAGLLSGLVVIALVAFVSRNSFLMLHSMSVNANNKACYPEIVKRILGPQGLALNLIAYLFYAGGLFTAYLMAVVDLMTQFAITLLGTSEPPRIPFVLAGLALSGAVQRYLQNLMILRVACMFGVALLVLALLIVCIGDMLPLWTPDGEVAEDVDFMNAAPGGLLAAASIAIVQFSIHAGGTEILGNALLGDELQAAGNEHGGNDCAFGTLHAETAVKNAFLAAALLVGAIGAVGYLRFGNNVSGNILSDLGPAQDDDTLSHVRSFVLFLTRAIYGLVLVVASTFIVIPCRSAALELFAVRRGMGGATNRAVQRVSYIIFAICGLIAWLATDLSMVLKLVGAWAAGPLVLILPSLCKFELARQQHNHPSLTLTNLRCLGLLTLGVLLPLASIAELGAYALSQPEGHRGHRVSVLNIQGITTRNITSITEGLT